MKAKWIIALALAAVLGLSSCKLFSSEIANDSTNNGTDVGQEDYTQAPTDTQSPSSQANVWFSDPLIVQYGINGLIPPSGIPGELLATNKIRYSNATEEGYQQYVYDAYGVLNRNNNGVYQYNSDLDEFELANIPERSIIQAGTNSFYYKVGDKIYNANFVYVPGTAPVLNTIEMSFEDVTEQYKDYKFK